jgi:hypothetical protein
VSAGASGRVTNVQSINTEPHRQRYDTAVAFTSVSDSTTVKAVPPQAGQAAECSDILFIHNEGSGQTFKNAAVSTREESKQRADLPPIKPLPPWPLPCSHQFRFAWRRCLLVVASGLAG